MDRNGQRMYFEIIYFYWVKNNTMRTEELIKGIQENFIENESSQWLIYRKKAIVVKDKPEDIYLVNENFEFILLKVWSFINEDEKFIYILAKQVDDPKYTYDESTPWPSKVEKVRIEVGQLNVVEDVRNSCSNIQTSINRIYQDGHRFEPPRLETIITILKNRKSFL